jgi:hypothetical protein
MDFVTGYLTTAAWPYAVAMGCEEHATSRLIFLTMTRGAFPGTAASAFICVHPRFRLY